MGAHEILDQLEAEGEEQGVDLSMYPYPDLVRVLSGIAALSSAGVQVTMTDADELHLQLTAEAYDRATVRVLIALIGQARPDECSWEEKGLRLWWD